MFLYGFLSTIIFLIAMPFVFVIRKCIGKPNAGLREKFGFIKSPFNKSDDIIMLHGVSVGEVIALENLAKKIKETFPNKKLVVTTGTKTGQEIAIKKYEEIADFITYFPFDIPFCVNRFLKRLNPSTVLIAETEIWPYFAYACNKRNVPVSIINGRISDSTFNSYLKVKFFFKQVFKNFTAVYTQSVEDKNKYIAVGTDENKVEVMGNLKFDVKRKEADIKIGQEGFRVIIAGSTHSGEDEIVLKSFKALKEKHADSKLMIVPRHPQRFEDVANLLKSEGLIFGKRSLKNNFDEVDVIMIDTMGELSRLYALCYIAFIGGSFSSTGGHNPLEASIWEKPVISGNIVFNFKDVYKIACDKKCAVIVKTPDELTSELISFYDNELKYKTFSNNAKLVFDENKGAINYVLNKI